jgi:hypothetical protein
MVSSAGRNRDRQTVVRPAKPWVTRGLVARLARTRRMHGIGPDPGWWWADRVPAPGESLYVLVPARGRGWPPATNLDNSWPTGAARRSRSSRHVSGARGHVRRPSSWFSRTMAGQWMGLDTGTLLMRVCIV